VVAAQVIAGVLLIAGSCLVIGTIIQADLNASARRLRIVRPAKASPRKTAREVPARKAA
jgi:hypothetical protein